MGKRKNLISDKEFNPGFCASELHHRDTKDSVVSRTGFKSMVGSYLTLVLPIARMYTVENVTYVN